MKDNKILQGLAGILLVLLSIFLVAKIRTTWAERDYVGKAVQDRDTFTVMGEGKVTATPDIARVEVGVTSEGTSPSAVQKDNTQKMNQIIADLKKLGIKSEDLQTSNYSLSPKIDWSTNTQRIIGYTVTQSLQVKIRNFDIIGDVLQTATSHGSNQIGGIQFTVDEPEQALADARKEAIDDARKKADTLADQLGLHIIRVITFSEQGGSSVPPVMPMAMDAARSSMEKAPTPDIQPGSLDLHQTVYVTYEVR